MIWFALGSFAGLYTTKPRDRGLRYNEVIAEQQRRDALGWRIETHWLPEQQRLEVAVFDATGQPLAPARLSAELVRPVEKRRPLVLALEATEVGRFAGHVDLPERGNWDLDVAVERDGQRYALTRRMFLK
jgi:nitrogen fixation protein FixH